MPKTKHIPTVESPTLTLRLAGPADADALELRAERDSARVPRGDVVVAELGGEVLAAVSVADHHAVANPFKPTAELVWLLHEHVRGLRRERRPRPRGLRRLRPVHA
jgi:hypothetical protein